MYIRRAVIAALVLIALGAAIFAIRTVTSELPAVPDQEQVSILIVRNPPALDVVIEGFESRMKELGYSEERATLTSIDVATDIASTKIRIQEAIAKEEPDAIFVVGILAARSAKAVIEERGDEIPVIFGVVSDPVNAGLVKDLRSSGNFITGITPASNLTATKRLEFLKDIIPSTKRIVYAWSDEVTSGVAGIRSVARDLGFTLEEKQLPDVASMNAYLSGFDFKQGDAILRTSDAIGAGALPTAIKVALENDVPLIGTNEGDTQKGALMSYGADYKDVGRASARIMDLVLRGTHPSDIPVEQASRFLISVNLKTAAEIGVTIPQTFLLKTNVVIPAE